MCCVSDLQLPDTSWAIAAVFMMAAVDCSQRLSHEWLISLRGPNTGQQVNLIALQSQQKSTSGRIIRCTLLWWPLSNHIKAGEQKYCCACGTWRLREGEAPWEKHHSSGVHLLRRPTV